MPITVSQISGYPTCWSLTKSSLTRAIHRFRHEATPLLGHPVFLTWASFETNVDDEPDPLDEPEPFRAGRRLRRSIAPISNESDLSTASSPLETDQPHEPTPPETRPRTSTSADESIPRGPSLPRNTADNEDNGSRHSNTPAVDPVFSEAQMQMLRGMMAQARN